MLSFLALLCQLPFLKLCPLNSSLNPVKSVFQNMLQYKL